MEDDFNAILKESEKEEGSDKVEVDMRNFQEVLNRCSLSDLGWSGDKPEVTVDYLKGLSKNALTHVSSYDWSIFSGSKVTNVSSIGLDHCSIMVEALGPNNQFGKRRKKWASRFHFEGFGSDYDECNEIISRVGGLMGI